jgi:hypothetical protein
MPFGQSNFMPNYSEGLRSLFAYATFGLLTVAGGAIWTAHQNLNAQADAAVAMVEDLVLAMQDVKLNLTEIHLSNLINSKSNGFPAIPPSTAPSTPPIRDAKIPESHLLTATRSLRDAERNLSVSKYWLVDDNVKQGFKELGADPPNVTIDPLKLDTIFGAKIPREATILGWSALVTAVATIIASLDVDGQGGGHVRRWFS